MKFWNGVVVLLAVAVSIDPRGARAEDPATPPAAKATSDGVTRFALDNGLRVILRPVEGSDEAAVVVLYSFGESSDPAGKSGLGHLFEHIYLTAAAGETPQRTYEDLANKYMGQINAQTGEDYTVAAAVAPAQSLDEELKDAAARMRGLTIEQSDLDREKPRMTMELANMYGGMPPLAARNEARGRVRPSPEGARRGGVVEQIQGVTLEEARDRMKFYKPCNATLVIVGGITIKEAEGEVREFFGTIPKGEPAPAARPGKAPALGDPLVLPLLPEGTGGASLNAYDAPVPGAKHSAAMLVMVSRLHAKLFQPGVTQQTLLPPLMHPVLDDPHILYISGPMLEGESAADAAKRLDALVDQAASGPVTSEERERVKTQVGAFLGLTPMPDEVAGPNPYGAAFSLGRRAQLGIDSAALGAALDALTEADLKACRDAVMSPQHRANVALVAKPKGP